MIVLLDTSILGQVSSPNNSGEARECKKWLDQLIVRGATVTASILCDYEVRRGLILASLEKPTVEGLKLLNELKERIDFLPVDQAVIEKAAQIWAKAQKLGQPTTNKENIDIDIIICAQWEILKKNNPGRYVVVATTNTKHIGRFAEAYSWRAIRL